MIAPIPRLEEIFLSNFARLSDRTKRFTPKTLTWVLLLFWGLVMAGHSSLPDGPSSSAVFPNGVASGDVTATSVVLWTYCSAPGEVKFELQEAPFSAQPPSPPLIRLVGIAATNQPVKAKFGNLNPGTRYFYRVMSLASAGGEVEGTFKTPAPPGTFPSVHFGVSGDWRGELAPFVSLRDAPSEELDFFVKLGDTIYADYPSPGLPLSQARTIDEFRQKHHEIYADRYGLNLFANLQRSAPIFATIDDHEVSANFAGTAPTGTHPAFDTNGVYLNQTDLYRNGLQVFHEFNPIEELTWGEGGDTMVGRPRLYRYRQLGQQAAIFLLDARSFRSPELAPIRNPLDFTEVADFNSRSFDLDPVTKMRLPSRTMLGKKQLQRLQADLLEAELTGVLWKFVFLPEPIQNLGVLNGEDRFDGFLAERTELLSFIKTNSIENVVFITADIHGTVVNNLFYQEGPGTVPIAVRAWEIVSGPVAYAAPFGPTVLDYAARLSFSPGVTFLDLFLFRLGLKNRAAFDALPSPTKDAHFQNLLNTLLTGFGYDPIGLDSSDIPATLEAGLWTAVHAYGWTEFTIADKSGELTVKTHGIDWYQEATPSITNLFPKIIQQFRVAAQGPRLAFHGEDGHLFLSWPKRGEVFQVEVANNPRGPWTAASGKPVESPALPSTHFQLEVIPIDQQRFYRLKRLAE